MLRTAPRSRRAPMAVTALALAAALFVGACSSDSGSDGSKEASKGSGSTTTTRAPIDPSDVDGGKAAYAKALAPVVAEATGLGADQATEAGKCLAPKWVDVIGVDGFAAAGFQPDDLEEMGARLGQLRVDESQAKEMAKGFDQCDVDLKAVAVAQLTAGPNVPASMKACLEEAITKESVEAGFIDNLLGKEAGAEVFAEAQTCLKAG